MATDKETEHVKGKLVQNEKERTEMVWHSRWVDEVLFPGPWIATIEWMKENNIHYICHDDLPNSTGLIDVYYPMKREGMFRATGRVFPLSTSDIICRILRDYDYHAATLLEQGHSRS